jgi:uncharacterized membrane protein YkgB
MTIRHRTPPVMDRAARWLAFHQARLTGISHDLLRFSLGLVFLLFGVLKFVPGLSPAEDIAVRAVTELTFGLMPAGVALFLVALVETTIGVSLLTGRCVRLGLALLGAAMIGILSPLVLFPSELFAGPVPTLMGQYVIKDIVLLAAALVLAVRVFARRDTIRPGHVEPGAGPHPAGRSHLDHDQPNRWRPAA